MLNLKNEHFLIQTTLNSNKYSIDDTLNLKFKKWHYWYKTEFKNIIDDDFSYFMVYFLNIKVLSKYLRNLVFHNSFSMIREELDQTWMKKFSDYSDDDADLTKLLKYNSLFNFDILNRIDKNK